jgi:hypothetical protein
VALRAFNSVSYIPLLNVRPAEVRAVEEMTERSKDELLPYIFLGPWASAHRLDSTLSRIEAAYENRPVVLDVARAEPEPGAPRREVHAQLDALCDPANGYRNWCEFVSRNENVIPALQIADPTQIPPQLEAFRELDRGVVVRFPRGAFAQNAITVSNIARALADARIASDDACFILDYQRSNRDILNQTAEAIGRMQAIWEAFPGCHLSVSSSSFPDGFERRSQEIFERLFFNMVAEQLPNSPLIYSDRGSARVERLGGGGGQPLPRVDYASSAQWSFFRVAPDDDTDPTTRPAAYQEAAVQALDSDAWDARLRIWGSQMIERTAAGDPDAIISPMRCTAVRINMHLHRQLFYDDPDAQYNTDEDWTD